MAFLFSLWILSHLSPGRPQTVSNPPDSVSSAGKSEAVGLAQWSSFALLWASPGLPSIPLQGQRAVSGVSQTGAWHPSLMLGGTGRKGGALLNRQTPHQVLAALSEN